MSDEQPLYPAPHKGNPGVTLCDEQPLYRFPYRGKPRFYLEGVHRDDETSSTTSTNIQIIHQNEDLLRFHSQPFPDFKQLTSPPTSPISNSTEFISPLTSPESLCCKGTKMPSSDIEIATQKVLKQCQYLICYICYELMYSRKTMNKKNMGSALYENYHGIPEKPHVLHQAWLFTQGKGKFSCAMQRSDDDGYFRLLPELTQENDFSFIIHEIKPLQDVNLVITLAMLKRKSINSESIFSMRSIQTYAETAVRNCKLATAFGKKFIKSDGSLPSGWSRLDFLNKVLDLMYDKISNEPKSKKIVSGDEREEVLAATRPKQWVFNGYMAFVLYGPLAFDTNQKSNLMSGIDETDGGLVSRKKARLMEQAIASDDPRKKVFDNTIKMSSNLYNTDDDKSVHSKISAHSKVSDHILRERKKQNDILLSTSLLNSKINTLTALASIHASNMQRMASSSSTMSEEQKQRMEKNEEKIDRLNSEIEELDHNIRSHFSKSEENSSSDSNPMLLLSKECKSSQDDDRSHSLFNNNDSLLFKTPNVTTSLPRNITVSIDNRHTALKTPGDECTTTFETPVGNPLINIGTNDDVDSNTPTVTSFI